MLKKLRTPGLIFLLIFSLLTRDRLLIFCTFLLWAVILVTRLWNRFCFSKLVVRRRLSRSNVFPGEETQYIIEIENRKILPVLWLQVNDKVTKGVEFPRPEMLVNLVGSPYNEFSDIFGLKWFEKVTRRYTVKPVRRGYYTFGKGVLKAADLFGLFTVSREEQDKTMLLVYPRVLPLEKLGLPAKFPFGANPAQGWIYEDPANNAGVRPYEKGDPMNRINWKATARYQNLHSNIIKPTLDTRLMIILNTRMMNNLWDGFNQTIFELAVICAASLADYGCQNGYHVGLLTNGIIYQEASFIKILPGKSSNQREKILKALAMIEPFHQNDIDTLVYREMPKWEKGQVVVFITVIMNQHLADALIIMKKHGFRPTIIKVGQMPEDFRGRLKDIPTYYLDEGEVWDEIENVQFSH